MSQVPPPIPPVDPSMPSMPHFGGPVEPIDEPKAWPKTIGIISIVWGALGVVCGGCGLLRDLASPMFQQMAASNPQLAQQMAGAPKASLAQTALGGVGILSSIFLIVAGSMLLSRRPVARLMHLGWAAFSLLLIVVHTLASVGPMQEQIKHMEQQMQAAQQGNPNAPPMPTAGIAGAMYGTLGCMAIFAALYPLFCLVWFGAVKRGTAEIANAPEVPAA